MKIKHTQRGMNLTGGPIGKSLFLFALPLFGSSLIQQLYNTVDLVFVGQMLGKEASAAVGAGSLLITFLLDFFVGMSAGVSVVTAKAFGGNKKEELKEIIHTAAGISLLGGGCLLVLGWIVSPCFLTWMHTPRSIQEMALTYLRTYFLSMFAVVAYNISSGILRALGDSRTPMYCQLFGGIANVIGDALFIGALGWGVFGVAAATLCSQTVAAVLTAAGLMRLNEEYRLKLRKICMKWNVCRNILKIGIPAAVQSMVMVLSNILVQSQINSLGVDAIAAYTAYFKVESFIYLPILAIGSANGTFTGQNIGAGQVERAKKGTRTALLGGTLLTAAVSGSLLLFPEAAFGLFSKDAGVIALGAAIAGVTFPFYFLYVFLDVLSSAIRGAGDAVFPMVISLVSMCGVRLIVLRAMMVINPSPAGVAVIYPATWIVSVVCLSLYYVKKFGRKTYEA